MAGEIIEAFEKKKNKEYNGWMLKFSQRTQILTTPHSSPNHKLDHNSNRFVVQSEIQFPSYLIHSHHMDVHIPESAVLIQMVSHLESILW